MCDVRSLFVNQIVLARKHDWSKTGYLAQTWGTARAEDAQGKHTQSHVSPSILVYEYYGEPSVPQSELGLGV